MAPGGRNQQVTVIHYLYEKNFYNTVFFLFGVDQ